MIHEHVNIALQNMHRFKLKRQSCNNHLSPEIRVFTLESIIPIARILSRPKLYLERGNQIRLNEFRIQWIRARRCEMKSREFRSLPADRATEINRISLPRDFDRNKASRWEFLINPKSVWLTDHSRTSRGIRGRIA